MAQASSTDNERPNARDRKIEILIGIVLIAVALTAIYIAMGFRSSGLASDVGPGRFPIIHATILIVLSGILVINNAVRLARRDYDPVTKPIPVHAVILTVTGIVATFAQFLTMDIFGYLLTMFIYLCFLMALMGMRHKVFNPVISAVITGAIYLTFDYLLNVPLPVGTLFE